MIIKKLLFATKEIISPMIDDICCVNPICEPKTCPENPTSEKEAYVAHDYRNRLLGELTLVSL